MPLLHNSLVSVTERPLAILYFPRALWNSPQWLQGLREASSETGGRTQQPSEDKSRHERPGVLDWGRLGRAEEAEAQAGGFIAAL